MSFFGRFASSAAQRPTTEVIQKRFASGSSDPKQNLANIKMMQKLSFASCVVIGVMCIGYFGFAPEEHAGPYKYPYLGRRNKEFPWGDGDTPLFNKFGGKHDPYGKDAPAVAEGH